MPSYKNSERKTLRIILQILKIQKSKPIKIMDAIKKYSGWIILGVILIVILSLCGTGCSTYNSMVTLEQEVDQQWAKVEVQYQRRLDLIPNLVETVKGYATHESETFQKVTEARAGLSNAYNDAKSLEGTEANDEQKFNQYNSAQADLNRAFNIYVNAVTEAYPELKADTQFKDLQTQLEGTENRIATERGRYTEVVKDYNVKIRRFPANIFAGIFGFQTKPQFQADAAAQSAPKVSF
jgi:LemA protein